MHDHRRRVGSRLDRQSLVEVAELARGCRLCRLCDGRTNVVFGAGAPDARVMFVTEAPGYHEDRSGLPFAGAAADLFGQLLDEAGLALHEVYVTSVVKCRPPRNRSPFPDEIEQCEGYLFREVTHVQPDVVCALGNVPIRLLTGRPHRLSVVHGQPMPVSVQGREVVVYPLYHPAAAVHVPSLVAALRADVRRLPRLLREAAAGCLSPALPEPVALAPATDAVPDAAPGPEPCPPGTAARPEARDDQLALDLG
jgi:uracil-DNA glycosylase